MKKRFVSPLLLISLFLTYTSGNAQITINKYAAVLDLTACNSLLVDSTQDFSVGDTVLMIQMKGAVVDTTNTSAFGNILNYNSAGNYEYNVVKSISGNIIGLKYVIVRTYDIPKGKVQLVKVPSFVDYTVSQPHTCQPWNGSKGGVFAIYTKGTLTINNSINLTGKGFRGGQVPLTTQYSGCNHSDYDYPATGNVAAQKGEGVAEISMSKMYGRGSLANGGGGGGDHNAGGGGGGNAGSGGKGGNQYQLGSCGGPIILDIGGVGGKPFAYSPAQDRIFLGGGGGAGHGNDLAEKPGAPGGGIAIINSSNIISTGGSVIANGADAAECSSATPGCQNDATGGGGGGGTILIKSGGYSGNLDIKVRGGKGANVWMGPTTPVGPGGGGGGGVILFAQTTIPGGTTNELSPGANGVLPQFSNSAWGALPGQSGQALTGFSLNFPVDSIINTGIDPNFTFARTSCFSFNFSDQSTVSSGNISSWLWDFSDNPGSSLQNPSHTFPDYGSYDVTLLIIDNNGCSNSVTKQVNIPYIHFANAGADVNVCRNIPVTLTASGGSSYSWNPPTGLSNPNAATTSANIDQSTTYIVTATNSIGCADKDTVLVNIDRGPDVEISFDGSGVSCNSKAVRLNATGAENYSWSPGVYCDDSTSSSPLVSPPVTTTFTVTGTNANGCSATDTVTVIQYFGNSELFMPNAFSPNGDGLNDKIGPVILCDFELDIFSIYNRYGQRIFTTNVPGKLWDGLFNDKIADAGTYFYVISGRKHDNKQVVMKGDITLIR